MNKPTLWITCGLSGSGKSTIATQIANENPSTVIVSSDAICEALTGHYEDQEHNEEAFKIFHDRIRKNLENKKNVIADATNLTMKSQCIKKELLWCSCYALVLCCMALIINLINLCLKFIK